MNRDAAVFRPLSRDAAAFVPSRPDTTITNRPPDDEDDDRSYLFSSSLSASAGAQQHGSGLLRRVFDALGHIDWDAVNGLRVADSYGFVPSETITMIDPNLQSLLMGHTQAASVIAAAIDRFGDSYDPLFPSRSTVPSSSIGTGTVSSSDGEGNTDSAEAVWLAGGAELSPDRSAIRRAPFPVRLRRRIEWYLGSNWERDINLQFIASQHGGLLPLRTLVGLRRVKALLDAQPSLKDAKARVAAVMGACEASNIVAVDHVLDPTQQQRQPGVRRRTLPERVARLFEELLSSRSVARNPFLLAKMAEREDGFVPLTVLLKLPHVQAVCYPHELAVAAVLDQRTELEVRDSESLELESEGTAGGAKPKRHYFVRMPDRRAMLALTTALPFSPGTPPSRAAIEKTAATLETSRPGVDGDDTPSFSVLTWNVLCQMYTPFHDYCDVKHLEYSYRRSLILTHLERLNADIVCLQELQGQLWKQEQTQAVVKTNSHHHDMAADILRACSKMGYHNVYARSSSPKIIDLGNALLWKKSAWEKVSHRIVMLADEMIRRIGEDDVPTLDHFVHKQVGVIARLKNIATKQELVVCTIHVACAFNNPEIQVAQVMTMLQSLWQASESGTIPCVFAGDFNALPFSDVYALLQNGVLDDTEIQRDMPAGVAMPSLHRDPDTGLLRHSLALKSAYAVVNAEPTCSNIKPDFLGCLDYIWYSNLVVRSVSSVPDPRELAAEKGGIPNSIWPSDHVPLVARFNFNVSGENCCPECGSEIDHALDDIIIIQGRETHMECLMGDDF